MIESTKTNAGTRKLPMTEEVFRCFQAILEDREAPRVEKMVGGYTGFLYLDKNGMPEVAMHWEHRFNHAVSRYNEIYREQLPNITPHICRHYGDERSSLYSYYSEHLPALFFLPFLYSIQLLLLSPSRLDFLHPGHFCSRVLHP